MAGQPTKMTDKTLQLLKDGFMRGYTVAQSCFYAGIGTTTYYTYLENNPEYQDKVDQYKENIKILAKNNVYLALEGEGKDNLKNGLDVLDRLEKENYSTKTENQLLGKDGKPADCNITVEFVKPK